MAEVWTLRDGLLAERHSYSTKAEALEPWGCGSSAPARGTVHHRAVKARLGAGGSTNGQQQGCRDDDSPRPGAPPGTRSRLSGHRGSGAFGTCRVIRACPRDPSIRTKPSKPWGCRSRQRRDTGRAMSQENVELVRRMWDAWLAGDVQTALSFFDPDVEWDGTNFPDGHVVGAMRRSWTTSGAGRTSGTTGPSRSSKSSTPGASRRAFMRERGRSKSGLDMDERHAELSPSRWQGHPLGRVSTRPGPRSRWAAGVGDHLGDRNPDRGPGSAHPVQRVHDAEEIALAVEVDCEEVRGAPARGALARAAQERVVSVHTARVRRPRHGVGAHPLVYEEQWSGRRPSVELAARGEVLRRREQCRALEGVGRVPHDGPERGVVPRGGARLVLAQKRRR